jgi:hypothetical protein
MEFVLSILAMAIFFDLMTGGEGIANIIRAIRGKK